MNNEKTLRDYFGVAIEVGDILLGANGKKHHWNDTEFNFSIVIGRTKGMLRVHKLGTNKEELNRNKDSILESISYRRGTVGGRALAHNFIRMKASGLTQEEINNVMKKAKEHQSTLGKGIQPLFSF